MSQYGTFRDNSVQDQVEIWKEEIASKLTAAKISEMLRETRGNQEQIKIWTEAIASKLTTSKFSKMIREAKKN